MKETKTENKGGKDAFKGMDRGTVRFIKITGGLLLAGFLYLIFVRLTGTGFHCPMRDITGLKCITCGITGMFVHISKGEFSEAFTDNRYVFITLPLIIFEIINVIWTFSHKRKLSRIHVGILWALLICGFIFMILRNIVMW